MHNANIEKNKIMRKVYLIWIFRKLYSPFVLESFSIVLLFLWLTSYVSFINVINNASRILFSPVDLFGFSISAFQGTELVAKLLAVIALIPFGFFLKDIFLSIQHFLMRTRHTS